MDLAPEHDSGGAPEPEMPHIHDYKAVKFLGKGGFGSVFLAKGVTRGVCALKVIFKNRDGNNHAFDREYKSLEEYSALAGKPPSLLQILHVGTGDGFFYYTMPLADDISGAACDRDNPDTYRPKTLENVIPGPGKAMPVRDAITAVLPVLDALDFLHRAGRLHRDVKPANILIKENITVLGDIGLLTETKPEMTQYCSGGYTPPGGVTTPAGDLYSVGRILLASVGGDVSKPGVSLPTVQSENPSELFPALNKVILKADALKYKSAASMRRDLEKILKKVVKRKRRPKPQQAPEPATPAAAFSRKQVLIAAAVMVLAVIGLALALMRGDGSVKGSARTAEPAPQKEQADKDRVRTRIEAALIVKLESAEFVNPGTAVKTVVSARTVDSGLKQVRVKLTIRDKNGGFGTAVTDFRFAKDSLFAGSLNWLSINIPWTAQKDAAGNDAGTGKKPSPSDASGAGGFELAYIPIACTFSDGGSWVLPEVRKRQSLHAQDRSNPLALKPSARD